MNVVIVLVSLRDSWSQKTFFFKYFINKANTFRTPDNQDIYKEPQDLKDNVE